LERVYRAWAVETAAERGSKGDAGDRGDLIEERDPEREWDEEK